MLQLADIFQPHMTLQRDKTIYVFGTSDPDSSVQAELKQALSVSMETEKDPEQAVSGPVTVCSACTKTQDDGSFLLELPPAGAGYGYSLSVTSGDDSITVEDIQIGDIWMAMGQSNMEYFLRYDADWDYTRLAVHRNGSDRSIRMYNVPQVAYEGQGDPSPANGVWFSEGDEPWRSFSAPGYYFAKYLRENGIDIPLAVVGCNWGGTPAQAWMSRDYLEKEPLSSLLRNYEDAFASVPLDELKETSMKVWKAERSYLHEMLFRPVLEGLTWTEQLRLMEQPAEVPELPMGPWHHYRPCGVYRHMVRKIAPFSVKGILWYQGESNCGEEALIYQATMEALVSCLRNTWMDSTLPFCFVQLAPFTRWLGCTGVGYAIVRQQQDLASASIPDSYVTNVMDLGERDDIHPKYKKEVGRRLAYLALQHTYGQTDKTGEAPVFLKAEECTASDADRDCSQKGGPFSRRFRLDFGNCGTGLAAEYPFGSAIRVYTEDFDSHSGEWPEGDCFDLTQEYFTGLTGFDYSRPIPVRNAEISGSSILFTVDLDRADIPLCISFAESDWCEVLVHSSDGIPVKPFHAIL